MKTSGAILIATVMMLGAASFASGAKPPAYLSAAIADPGRPAADTRRDDEYKPATVIAFAGVKPGSKVADFMPGDGYYSRIFSKIVGARGYVYAYYATQDDTPAARRGKVGGALAAYHNVGIISGPADKFVTPESVEIVWTALTYHDLFEKIHFKNLDVAAVNRAVFASLKPGGIYIVIDRAAKAGAGLGDIDTLYRIDEAAVKAQLEAAGFKLIGESSALHNPADNHTTRVAKSDIGVKPDQFMLKFQKPHR